MSLHQTNTATNEACGCAETVKPALQVRQTDEAYFLTLQVPGATREGLEVTADDGKLRIFAPRAWRQPEGWTSVYRESTDAPYELVVTHDRTVDAGKIAAELSDGVLRVTLPKHEAVRPRKIAVA